MNMTQERDRVFLPYKNLVLGNDADFENARKESGLKKDEIEHLARSIEKDGMLDDIIVRPHPEKENTYVVISGERRYRALGIAIKNRKFDADRVNCKVDRSELQDAYRVALVANVQRSDLNGVEVARGLQQLVEQGKKQAEIAKECGKSTAWVSLYLGAFKKTTDEVREAWQKGKITDVNAFTLAKIDNPKKQNDALDEMLKLRESGKKGAKGQAAKVANAAANKDKKRSSAKNDDDDVDKPSNTEIVVLAEELKAESDHLKSYSRGIRDALLWVLGEIGYGEFEEALGVNIPSDEQIEAKNVEIRNKKKKKDLFEEEGEEDDIFQIGKNTPLGNKSEG